MSNGEEEIRHRDQQLLRAASRWSRAWPSIRSAHLLGRISKDLGLSRAALIERGLQAVLAAEGK
jgi:hypothetical protein